MKNLILILGITYMITACGGEPGSEGGGASAPDAGTNAPPPAPKITILDLWKDAEAAIKACDTNALATLIKENPEQDIINAKNKNNLPLIHAAVSSTCIDAVKFLVGKKVEMNVMDMTKRYPIHAAASKSNLAMMKYLVSIGQDVKKKTGDGLSVLDKARNNTINMKDYQQERRLLEQYLYEQGVTQ